jgi:SAM domain (Sterile alpha motif)/WD domain, G-beta repeat
MQPECIVCAGHTGAVSSVSIPHDGALYTGSHDGTLRSWTTNGEAVGEFRAHNSKILSVATALEGRLVATGSNFGSVRLWTFQSGRAVCVLNANHGFVPILAIACAVRQPIDSLQPVEITPGTWKLADSNTGKGPNGIILVSSATCGTAKLWDVNTGSVLRKFRVAPFLRSVALSPNGNTLVTGSDGGKAMLWNVDTGAQTASLSHANGVKDVALSTDGLSLLVACGDTAILWDVKSVPPTVKQYFKGHTALINCVAFKPDDDGVFVTGSNDTTVKLWKFGSADAIFSFDCHKAPVLSVAFSPTGSHILTGSADKTAALWDLSHVFASAPTASRFVGLMQETNYDISDSALYDLFKDLVGTVSDVQELRLFYTLISAALRKGAVTKPMRDNFVAQALARVSTTFKFDQENQVLSTLLLILNKAEEDQVVSSVRRIELESQYRETKTAEAYHFQSLVAVVKRQSEQISSLGNYVSEFDQRIRTQKATPSRADIGLIPAIIPIIGSIDVAMVENCFERIVDFSDHEHVSSICTTDLGEVNETSETIRKVKESSDTPLDDLLFGNESLMPIAVIIRLSMSMSYSGNGPEARPSSVRDVLEKLDLAHHKEAFDTEDITDVGDLLELTEKDLEDIGLKKIGERNRMRSWIEGQKKQV